MCVAPSAVLRTPPSPKGEGFWQKAFGTKKSRAGINGAAGGAAVTGIAVLGIFTVDRLCKDLGAAGLTGTAGTGK